MSILDDLPWKPMTPWPGHWEVDIPTEVGYVRIIDGDFRDGRIERLFTVMKFVVKLEIMYSEEKITETHRSLPREEAEVVLRRMLKEGK